MHSVHSIEAAAELLEGIGVAKPEVESAIEQLLIAFGENVDREGLERTPERVARMYDELLAGYHVDRYALINEAVFDVGYDDMVIVRDIEFYSMCEHHLLPFLGKANVAYIPSGKVIGLSKIPRIVDLFARRLQVQERMTNQISEFLEAAIHPQGVAVVLEGLHLCSKIRGVKKADARMITSSMTGVFRHNQSTRQEFMFHLERGDQPLTV
jgi:GTP cyclohydrolase I